MAGMTTQVTIAGNLTRDPEVRFGQGGQAVTSFSVASTPRSWNRETKEYVDGETIFTNCVIFGKPAENLGASLRKGSRVIATGSFKSRTYQAKDGETKTSTELVVDEMGASLLFSAVEVLGRSSVRTVAPDVPMSYPATGGPSQVPDQGDVPW
jgi:single-strand DNA-binding protein